MAAHSDVIHQMEKIKYIFQHALYISTEQENSDFQHHLDGVDPEFRSVAYEGLAMGLAEKDFQEGTLQRWRTFMRASAAAYLPHIYVGLGWSIAKQRLETLIFLESLPPLLLSRTIDGMGYYDGTFRSRQSIQSKIRPDCIDTNDFAAYDQGLGRSLWYTHKGDINKIKLIIQNFPTDRQNHLWRGVGIACVFVGKCDALLLDELMKLADKHRLQLAIGAIIVAKARTETKTVIASAEKACRIWCNLSVEEALQTVKKIEFSIKDEGNSYFLWLSNLEHELSNGILNLS